MATSDVLAAAGTMRGSGNLPETSQGTILRFRKQKQTYNLTGDASGGSGPAGIGQEASGC